MAGVVVAQGQPYGGEADVYRHNGSRGPTAGSDFWAASMATTLAPITDVVNTFNDVTIPTARDWLCIEALVTLSGSDLEDDVFTIFDDGTSGSGWEIRGIVITTGSTYKVRLYFNGSQVGPDGITTISDSGWRQMRRTWLSGQIALEVDGTLELNASTSEAIPAMGLGIGPEIGHGGAGSVALRRYFQKRGDSGAERPDETDALFAATEIDFAGGSSTHTGWTNDSSYWDDWNSDGTSDDDSTHAQAPQDTEDYESRTVLSAPTLSLDEYSLMVHLRPGVVNSLAGKDFGNAVICDGTNDREVAIGFSSGFDGYTSRHAMFNLAPDDATWDQDALDNLELAFWGKSVTDAHDLRMSTVWGEGVEHSIDAGDPPALGTPHSFGTIIG